jgi:hypothetical protein
VLGSRMLRGRGKGKQRHRQQSKHDKTARLHRSSVTEAHFSE